MDRLWAPWRMEYIGGERRDACIFCEKPKLGSDAEALILARWPRTFVMMNRYPYVHGHLLVSPYEHASSLLDLSAETLGEMGGALRDANEALRQVLKPGGFNVGLNIGRVGGAGYEEHLHFHIVPRWAGDTNFMPLFSETRVIPEHLNATYEKLLPFFNSLSTRK